MTDKIIQVLHISDLHYTRQKEGSINACRALFLEMERQYEDGLLRPESIFISGDLVYDGSRIEDYEGLNTDLLVPLLKLFNLKPSCLFIVPGNHDIDRNQLQFIKEISYESCNEDGAYEEKVDDILRKLLNKYLKFIEKHEYSSINSDAIRTNRFEMEFFNITLINGLVGCYAREGNKDKGKLFTTERTLQKLNHDIKKHEMVIMHHPLTWHDDEAEQLLHNVLSEKKAILFNGHLHSPKLDSVVSSTNSLTICAAGATHENKNKNNTIGINWVSPSSGSIYNRTLNYDYKNSRFSENFVDNVQPSNAKDYFISKGLFTTKETLENIAIKSAQDCSSRLKKILNGHGGDNFIEPEIAKMDMSTEIPKSVTISQLIKMTHNIFINGSALSGKTSLLLYLASNRCSQCAAQVPVYIDYRLLKSGSDSLEKAVKRQLSIFIEQPIIPHTLLERGNVTIFLDNFDANNVARMNSFESFLNKFTKIRLVIANYGEKSINESVMPVIFKRISLKFYKFEPMTAAKARKIIARKGTLEQSEENKLLKNVFQSINKLGAPRTIFYVDTLAHLFTTEKGTEPLNRFLLLDNMLQRDLRNAAAIVYEELPYDFEIMMTATASVVKGMYEDDIVQFSKDYFVRKVSDFKVLKDVDIVTDKMFEVLLNSRTLVEVDQEYYFRLQCFESFFLSFQMKHDKKFKSFILEIANFKNYAEAIEFYAAANPSDKDVCDRVFEIMEELTKDIPNITNLEETLSGFVRGNSAAVEQNLLEALEESDQGQLDKRVESFIPEAHTERGSVFSYSREVIRDGEKVAVSYMLAASVMGVARLLDKDEKEELLVKFIPLIEKKVAALLWMAAHLAEGNSIEYDGVEITANLSETKIERQDYAYVIAKGLIMSLYQSFGVRTGSSHLYGTTTALIEKGSDGECFLLGLLAQNFESELIKSISKLDLIKEKIPSTLLQEVAIELFSNQAKLTSLTPKIAHVALTKVSEIIASWENADKEKTHKLKARIESKLRMTQLVSEAKGLKVRIIK